jgi:hypothetical protein
MKVASQYFGYAFKLLAFVLCVYFSVISLNWIHHIYGAWGYVVGLLLLPILVPGYLFYQAFAMGLWINLVGLLVLVPLLWKTGTGLIRWGRVPRS